MRKAQAPSSRPLVRPALPGIVSTWCPFCPPGRLVPISHATFWAAGSLANHRRQSLSLDQASIVWGREGATPLPDSSETNRLSPETRAE